MEETRRVQEANGSKRPWPNVLTARKNGGPTGSMMNGARQRSDENCGLWVQRWDGEAPGPVVEAATSSSRGAHSSLTRHNGGEVRTNGEKERRERSGGKGKREEGER